MLSALFKQLVLLPRYDFSMQHTCPWRAAAAEDHELVTDSEDDEADATAKFVEHERREVARKVAEAEQQRKVEEARAEVQRRKEVRDEHTVC